LEQQVDLEQSVALRLHHSRPIELEENFLESVSLELAILAEGLGEVKRVVDQSQTGEVQRLEPSTDWM
jgi:hypothetical protein